VTRSKSLVKDAAHKNPPQKDPPQKDPPRKDPPRKTRTRAATASCQAALADSSSETVDTCTVSTPPNTAGSMAKTIQPSPAFSPASSSSDLNDDNLPKGLAFFNTRSSNIVNFNIEENAVWRKTFGESHALCGNNTKKKEDQGAVDLCVIGRVFRSDLLSAQGPYNRYHLELQLERDTSAALQSIMDTGPLKASDNPRNPIYGPTASFSAKVKAINKEKGQNLDASQPFPYIWDGSEMRPGQVLKRFPPDNLLPGYLIAVETNISSYVISQEDGSQSVGYSLSLRTIYVLKESVDGSGVASLKRPGDHLVSPRKNKKAGERAVFSDED